MDEQKSSPLQSFTPKQIFLFGVVGGVLVLCTIGFFILLAVMLDNGGFGREDAANPSPGVEGVRVDNNPQAAADITVRPVDAKTDHIRGAKDAKITIVEYSDFECPFCKNFHSTMIQVISAYPNDVRWVYRHFPLDSLHRQARHEALASECAAEQGKFWEFADLIFQETTSNDGLDLTKLPEYARRLGLNVTKFNECLTSSKYAAAVQEDERDAQAAGAQGTPYSVILGPEGQKIPVSGAQPFANVKTAVDSLL